MDSRVLLFNNRAHLSLAGTGKVTELEFFNECPRSSVDRASASGAEGRRSDSFRGHVKQAKKPTRAKFLVRRLVVLGLFVIFVLGVLKFAATKTGLTQADASQPPNPIPVASPTYDCEANSPTDPVFVSQWVSEFGAEDYNATITDLVNGCKYEIGDSTKVFPMASTGKVMVATGILEKVAAGSLTYESVQGDMTLMITQSDNNAADRLFKKMGKGAAMSDLINRYGLTSTSVGKGWGTTLTNSADQSHLLDQVVGLEESPLPEAQRAILRDLMTHVNPEQAWGAGRGVPEGWTGAVKNGWYLSVPGDIPPVGLWRINSLGYVWDESGVARWSVAGYSNTWATQERGESAWSALSAHAADILAD